MLSGDSPALARAAAVEAAEDTIVEATGKADAEGPGYSRAARTLRAFANTQGAGVALGTADVPDAAGWEWGAHHDVERQRANGSYKGFNQFGEFRGSGESAGYFASSPPFARPTATSTATCAASTPGSSR